VYDFLYTFTISPNSLLQFHEERSHRIARMGTNEERGEESSNYANGRELRRIKS